MASGWSASAPRGAGPGLHRGLRIRQERWLQRHKRDAVLLVPGPEDALPEGFRAADSRALAALDADLLFAPPQAESGQPGLGAAAPATILVDSGGIVRRIETGRLLAGKELADFVEQWRLGREVFLYSCARCHGDDGSLNIRGDVKTLTGIGNRLTPAQVYERLRVGELSDIDVLIRGRFHKRKEVEAVVVFVRGL